MNKTLRITLLALLLVSLAAVKAQDEKKVFGLEDYPLWSRIVSPGLSDDGRWAAYGYKPLKGDDTLYIRNLASDEVISKPFSTNPSFSPNSLWAAYFRSIPEKQAETMRKNNRKVYRKAVLMNLATKSEEVWDRAESIQFSPSSNVMVVKKVAEGTDARGSDLIIKSLTDGWVMNLGNVREFRFNRQGNMLAYTVDATAKTGNGLYLFEIANQRIRPLDTDTLEYIQLTWDDDMLLRSEWGTKGTSLAVLKGATAEGKAEKVNSMVIIRNVGTPKQVKTIVDPSATSGFPEDYVLSENGSLTFTFNNAGIMFAIKEQTPRIRMSRDTIANVDVWHYADERIQSVQMRQATGDRRTTYRAILWFDKMNVIQLNDDDLRILTMDRDGLVGLGRDPKSYISDTNWGGAASDLDRKSVV